VQRTLTDNALAELTGKPESETLEFKKDVRDVRAAARELAALANSGGGQLLVGVDDRRGIVGVPDTQRVLQILDAAARTISPPVDAAIYSAVIASHSVVVAEVASGDDTPHVGADGTFARRTSDGRRIAFNGADLVDLVARRAQSMGRGFEEEARSLLAEMNMRLEEANDLAERTRDDVNREAALAERERNAAARARSWRSQFSGWLISGVIGVLLGLGATQLAHVLI
jgi:predicted HTH transcriptional regulator